MAARIRLCMALLGAVLSAQAALAQEAQPELTPAGKASLKELLAYYAGTPAAFPHAICTFRGGLCGAVRRDGTVAVPPRYDWVGRFSEGRAAVRLGGLYGFVDEDGREVVEPRYRIVDDYRHGFAQVDVDGKSGLIDRDGKMVIPPKYGSIIAIGPDRFRVSDVRHLGGSVRAETFFGPRLGKLDLIEWLTRPPRMALWESAGIIDISGQWIEPPSAPREFDKDNPSMRWAWRDNLWGLQRPDGSWFVEPKFEKADRLIGELTRVMLNGKVGFIDRDGKLAIEPVFDEASPFTHGSDRTSAVRKGVPGVIDKTGAWVSQADEQQIPFEFQFGVGDRSKTIRGRHLKKGDRWGLLDRDGRVVLDADFDMPIDPCAHTLVASKSKEWLRFKWDGSPLQPPNGRFVDGSCSSPFALKIGDKIGLVAADGTPLTPIQFGAVARVRGLAWNVKLNGKWARIAHDGSWLNEPKFDYLSTDEGLRVAAVDGKRGVLRFDGSWLIEPRFDAAQLIERPFDTRLLRHPEPDSAFVTISGATGLLRLKDQSWAIQPRPGVMCDIPYSNAIIWQTGSKLVLLSRTGETWYDIEADRIGPIREDGLVPFRRNGKWGLADTAGQVMVEPQFDELDVFVRGIAWAKRDGRWCAIDRRARVVPSIACTDAVPVDLGRDTTRCQVEP